jgi:hypothetical protein
MAPCLPGVEEQNENEKSKTPPLQKPQGWGTRRRSKIKSTCPGNANVTIRGESYRFVWFAFREER